MKKCFKKSLSLVLFCALLLVPTVSYAMSCTTKYNFTYKVEGTSRSYSAGTLRYHFYECGQGTDGGYYHPASSVFYVYLYQDHFMNNPYIGRQTVSRTGGTISWENMAKDNYFINLEKASDGCRLTGKIDISQ